MQKIFIPLIFIFITSFLFNCAGTQKNDTLIRRVEIPEWANYDRIPQPQRDQIIDIVNTASDRDNQLNKGNGLRVLLTEPGKTNKLFAAKVIANRLNKPLYRIDLSQVVNKYIGETEKNLGKLFEKSEYKDVILLFDEADALFGRRTEVKDAHDRYANQDTNYLLQRIETYDGLVILVSNNRQNEVPAKLIELCEFVIHIPD